MNLPINWRRKLIRGKDSLLRNDQIEVGFICINSYEGLVPLTVNLYFTSLVRLKKVKTAISSPNVPVQTNNIDMEEMQPNSQHKQPVEFGVPTLTNIMAGERPSLEINFFDDAKKEHEHTVLLPFSLLRMGRYEPITDQSKFVATFRESHRLLMMAGPVRYSQQLISEPISLLQMLPNTTLLDNQAQYL